MAQRKMPHPERDPELSEREQSKDAPPAIQGSGSLIPTLLGRRRGIRRACSRRNAALVDQPVELAGVLAGDLVRRLGRQVTELLGDVFARFRPDAVAMRVVAAPHQRLQPHLVDELGADAVELEGRLALAPPVVARLHLESQILEAVLPFEIHAVERVWDPADAALAKGDAQIGISL